MRFSIYFDSQRSLNTSLTSGISTSSINVAGLTIGDAYLYRSSAGTLSVRLNNNGSYAYLYADKNGWGVSGDTYNQWVKTKAFTGSNSGVTTYPTQPGIYRVTNSYNKTYPFDYGTLFIFGGGYYVHMAISTGGNIFIGITSDVIKAPSTWVRIN